jgi:hypothetical protein
MNPTLASQRTRTLVLGWMRGGVCFRDATSECIRGAATERLGTTRPVTFARDMASIDEVAVRVRQAKARGRMGRSCCATR